MGFMKLYPGLLGLVLLLVFAQPTLAFGAGTIASISKVSGQNWRHGDIEDTLLNIVMAQAVGGKKFNKMMVLRVYFGNWLRDYSQAIDVGTVKAVSAEAIRLLLCVLGFMSFGFGSKEFEVTAERLGCYRPEDHIDNPKNYADNEDARQYHRALRGPIDEGVELAIDEETGMKNYISNDRAGIMTSSIHVRRLFSRSVELVRNYQHNRNKADFYEALRLLGTGLHCLEDYLAHSNYTELALYEMGERDVFPHVGSRTQMQIPGVRHEVWPIVTGTFGGVDFLHSVTGEVSDKLTQNEIQELEGALQQHANDDTSVIGELLDKIPDGVLGGDNKKQKMSDIQDNAHAAQMENTSISPKEPEEFTRQAQQIFQQIMPAIEFHDDLLKSINKAIERIPILPQILEQLEEQLSMWVFTIIAPFVLPIISQVKAELATGSSEIISSSENEQHIVFNDDSCTDPTHSMLSKDHFSNILNEIAGRTASKVVAWVTPQVMELWDNENADVDRTLDRIINGVLHHPAQRHMGEDGAEEGRQIMFRSVEEWWNELGGDGQDEYRQKLSRDGVYRGENHKEGVNDCGHGCGKPLGMHKNYQGAGSGSVEDRIAGAAAGAIFEGLTGGKIPGQGGNGDEPLGGGLLGQIGNSLLGGAFKNEETRGYESRREDNDGSYTESRTEYGHSNDRYGQANMSETQYSGGGERVEYSRYEQDDSGRGYGYQERTETRPAYGGGYEERVERRYESNEDSYQESSGWNQRRDEDSYGGRGDGYRDERSEHERSDYGRQEYGESGGYGREDRQEYGRSDDYGRENRQDSGRSDDRRDEEESGGGGFLGRIIDRVGDELRNRRRDE
ncbi:heterokaryon incompatibility protein Het-C-domain-containing protein [Astrocystis sublimbata]|nr:heterokaryon incompatibility protein Het-C-domain-containing protein [Astrocystis sublimbata]